jgi:hypothetical protein
MRFVIVSLGLLLANACGCSQQQITSPRDPSPEDPVMGWPKDWASLVGNRVTLEGKAVDAKIGALLQGENGMIWIEGLDSWPVGFYTGGDSGTKLRVIGTVIKKDDLPVFIQKPGEPLKSGMPVKSEEELEKAKWRYLLKDARWTVLDEK